MHARPLRIRAGNEYLPGIMSALPESRPSPTRPSERGKVQRELAGLLTDIAATRADLGRQAEFLRSLHHHLDRELRPWEAKLAATRRETLRILGRHSLTGWLPRRDCERLREALRGLADELEAGFGLDVSAERREFLGQGGMSAAEAEVRSRAEQADREARLAALRKAIGNEDGPRKAAAQERRERMEGLRKALRDEGGTSDQEQTGAAKGGGARRTADAVNAGAEKETSIAGDIRALYLLLARALHPDKEGDPERRETKTAWMQKVTTAYAARDLAKLLDILAADPLGSVGPYLSGAPVAVVKGFAKRLRRELAALRAKAEIGRTGVHASLRRFLGTEGINEAEVKRYAAELKKEVRFVKERNEWYRERSGVVEMLRAMGGDWRGFL
jgi:hypothetical protein